MSATRTPEKPARAEPLLELMVDADPRGQVDSRTPVRWCVGKSMLEELERRGYTKPYVVLVVRSRTARTDYDERYSYWQDTAIYAAPLTQEMQYMSFVRPGRNDIRAFVVQMSSDTAKWLRLTRRRIGGGSYDTIFDDQGQLKVQSQAKGSGRDREVFFADYFDTSARVRVIVPPEMFAAEPAPWRQNLVHAYGMSKGPDQCGFRKRFWLAALPPTLLGIPLWAYIPKLFALALYLFFGRLPNKGFWKTATQPLNLTDWVDSLAGFSASKWWHGKQAVVLGVLNPPILLILPTAVWGIMHLPFHHYHVNGHSHHSAWYPMSWTHVLFWVDGVLAAALLASIVAFVLGSIIWMGVMLLISSFPKQTELLVKLVVEPTMWFGDKWKQWRLDAAKARRERRHQAKLQLETELAAMTCRSEGLVVDLSALPKEKQTVYLKFNDFLTKVCKPFAA